MDNKVSEWTIESQNGPSSSLLHWLLNLKHLSTSIKVSDLNIEVTRNLLIKNVASGIYIGIFACSKLFITCISV